MRSKCANLLIGLGSLLVVAALGLFLYNQQQSAAADRSAAELMTKLVSRIEQETPEEAAYPENPYEDRMDTVTVDGMEVIGYLVLPDLQVELPILADGSPENLAVAPCRYYGSVNSRNLVLMGHNYTNGFGQLAHLEQGDRLYFRDVHGVSTHYRVTLIDVLSATSVEEMIRGDFDLTLFTCTYGGKNRLTIRCDQIG